MQGVKVKRARRADAVKRGERWAANCLECFNMAKAFSCCLPDEEKNVNREAAREWLKVWGDALQELPHDEAMAARLIHCERLDAGEAAQIMGLSRIKAAGLAARACGRLAEYFGRRVECWEHWAQNCAE